MPQEEQNLPPGAHRGNDREKLLGFDVVAELLNLGDTRLAAMDAAGIDVQVLSHNQPGCQALDADAAIPMAREVNDLLFETIKAHPDRFAGLAALPTAESCGCGEGARPRSDPARLQRRNDQRSHPGHVHRQQEVLVHLRVRAGAAGPGLPAPKQATPRGDASLFRRIRGIGARRLGLRHRHRRAFSPPRLCRGVRCVPSSDFHPRPPRRGPAVHAPPDQRPDPARGCPPRSQAHAGAVFDGESGGHLQRQFLPRPPSFAP